MMNSLDNGFLRPFKSYPTYKPSSVDWLGDIPAHWGKNTSECNDVHNVAGKLCMQGIANHDSNA